jgi:hypothetical protein
MADPVQTQNINYGFAPEAAPYAQDVLGQAQALTDFNANPYQQYQGDTIAQFTPLQNLAFGNAATMSSAPQLQDASALAGMAGLGALNQQYTFQPSNFTQANYSQMANPYLDVMNAATNRNAQIQQAGLNAQATTAGAFGGGRQAIMGAQNNAELQRNLGKNQFDAYNQAQQQYNTQNQQNAQQQQFGAGLGLQGLQTALTGANALSNIGQTQYGQNMGINQLQAQYGGAQQQQVQNGLNQQQQQFLNYQNYPYQQLNFMQNMIRGLPMTNQTASVYQSPGSMLGQVAGLGIGAAAALNKKDGGSISSYKEGGEVKKFDEGGDITDPSEGKLHQMMGSLSDPQLQQILQHPTSMAEFQAAQQEMSFRQSVHQGMREGGAVAFKDGGDKGEESSGLGPLAYLAATAPALYQMGKAALSKVPSGMFSGAPTAAARTVGSAGSTYMSPVAGPVIGGGMALSDMSTRYLEAHPEAREALLGDIGSDTAFASAILNEGAKTKEKKDKYESKVGGGRGGDYSDKYDTYLAGKSSEKAEKARLLKDEFNKSGLKDVAKNAPSLGEARKVAEGMGVKTEDFDSIYKRVYGDLSKGNADIIKSIRELTAEQIGEAKNIKAEGGRKALMNFGFNLAAESARPGVAGNKGFAGLLRSAAAASPSYAASLADTDKMARESQRLANQMQIEMTKYQVQLDKGDKAGAIQSAHNIQANQLAQQHLAETITHNRKTEQNQAAQVAMMGQRYAAMQGNNAFKFGNFRKQAITQADKNYADELRNDIMLPKKLKEQGLTPEQYKKRRSDEIYGSILQSVAGPLMPLED